MVWWVVYVHVGGFVFMVECVHVCVGVVLLDHLNKHVHI